MKKQRPREQKPWLHKVFLAPILVISFIAMVFLFYSIREMPEVRSTILEKRVCSPIACALILCWIQYAIGTVAVVIGSIWIIRWLGRQRLTTKLEKTTYVFLRIILRLVVVFELVAFGLAIFPPWIPTALVQAIANNVAITTIIGLVAFLLVIALLNVYIYEKLAEGP